MHETLTTPRTRTKAIALAGTALLWPVVALLLVVPPADGYEASIYGAYPWYFWACVVGAFFAGAVVVVRSALFGGSTDRSWTAGLALMLVVDAILVLLPLVRGYPVYGRADTLTHVGIVRDLADAGVDGPGVIYPNTHAVVQTLTYATGIDPLYLVGIVAPAVSLIYFGGIYLLVGHLFERRRRRLLGYAFVAAPVAGTAHVVTVPFGVSVLLVPFVLYLFVKEQRTNAPSVRAALIPVLVAFVLYHPLTTLFLVAALVLYLLARRVRRFGGEWTGPTTAVSFTVAVFGAWYFSFVGIILRFRGIFETLLGVEEGETQLETYSETVSSTSPDLIDLVRVAAFRYGAEAWLTGLGTVFVVVALYLWWRGEYSPTVPDATFVAVFLTFTAAAVAFLVNDFIVGWGRPLVFQRLFAVVLAAGLFYLLWRRAGTDRRRKAVVLSLYAALFVLAFLTVLSVFPSLQATELNDQVTEMELDGTEWVFERRNEELHADEFGIRQHRFHDAHYGFEATDPTIRQEGTAPPAHFNYTEHETLGASYERDTYLLLNRKGRVAYPAQFPDYREHWQYTPEDFQRLERDRTVTRLYDNGEFETYLIDGNRTAADG